MEQRLQQAGGGGQHVLYPRLGKIRAEVSPLGFTTTKHQWPCVSVTRSRPTLCDPRNCSPLGSSIHGILQARILEWVAIPFSREQWLCWESFQSHGGVKPAVDREGNQGDGNGGRRLLMQSRRAPAGMMGRWASFKCWPCDVTLPSHSQHWKEAHLYFLYLTGSFPVGSDSKESAVQKTQV